jgi:hypothetical protein
MFNGYERLKLGSSEHTRRWISVGGAYGHHGLPIAEYPPVSMRGYQ